MNGVSPPPLTTSSESNSNYLTICASSTQNPFLFLSFSLSFCYSIMEALFSSSSTTTSTCRFLFNPTNHSSNTNSNNIPFSFLPNFSHITLRLSALPTHDNNNNDDDFSFLSHQTILSQDNLITDKDTLETPPPTPQTGTTTGGGGGGVFGGSSRAGLFRTPISGGVQSATSAHGLPKPALAVRNLLEQARFAHLCTVMSRMHHRREGYPFGSLVDFAPDPMGHPVFSFSPLAIHTRNLLADPRCTLVVQIPGWSGLSNARVTLFGDVYPLTEDQQEWAHKQYIAKHHQGPSQQWGNSYYFRMQNISDIYFIGGFGTVAWVDVKEYETIQPDKIAVDGGEQNLKELNAIFSKPLKKLLSTEIEVDDAALISIDSKGTDVRVRQGAQFNIQRISFDEGHSVETLEEAKDALWKVIEKGKVHNLQK